MRVCLNQVNLSALTLMCSELQPHQAAKHSNSSTYSTYSLELSVWPPQCSEYVSAQNKRYDCADLFSIWHYFCSSKTAMASLMQPPELHSALNNATTALPRVWYCYMSLQHPQFASSQHIHRQKSSLVTTVKFRQLNGRRGSNRNRLFQTGRKLEDKEPGRLVQLYLLNTTFCLSTGKYVPSPAQTQAKSLGCCCSLMEVTSI